MSRKLTTEEFIEKAKKIHGDRYDYSKSKYLTCKDDVEIICKTHGSFWQPASSHLRGHGCFKCSSTYKDNENFVKQAKDIHGEKYNYSKTVYKNARTKITIGCPIHVDVEMSPKAHLRSGCKMCAQSKVDDSNRISMVRPELVKYFKNKDNANNYSEFSNKKEIFICPDCGMEKEMSISTLTRFPFSCKACSDTVSIGEKFIFNLLKFLNLEFTCQYNDVWSDNKRYDFYIPSLNFAIEASGSQHFRETGSNLMGKLEDIQENDRYKEYLAKSNGVENYTHVDCSVYDFEFLKCSCVKSLSTIIPNVADISDDDWFVIWENSVKSRVILAVNLWNKGNMNIKDIAKELGMHHATIRNYLKIGNSINLCEFSEGRYSGKNKLFFQYDKDLNLIGSYRYVQEAVEKTGISKESIWSSLYNTNHTGAGFYWAYEDEDVKDRVKPKKNIYKYDLNLNLIEVFHSVKEASNSINSSETYVSYNLNGKTKTCKGFIFSYVPLHEVEVNENN